MTIAGMAAQIARRGRMLCLVCRYMFCTAQHGALSLLGSVHIETERTIATGATAYHVAT